MSATNVQRNTAVAAAGVLQPLSNFKFALWMVSATLRQTWAVINYLYSGSKSWQYSAEYE